MPGLDDSEQAAGAGHLMHRLAEMVGDGAPCLTYQTNPSYFSVVYYVRCNIAYNFLCPIAVLAFIVLATVVKAANPMCRKPPTLNPYICLDIL